MYHQHQLPSDIFQLSVDNAAHFPADEIIHTVPIIVPPGTHYCRVGKGGVVSNLAQFFCT